MRDARVVQAAQDVQQQAQHVVAQIVVEQSLVEINVGTHLLESMIVKAAQDLVDALDAHLSLKILAIHAILVSRV